MTNLPAYDDGWRAGYKLGRWQAENYWSRKAAEMAKGRKAKDPQKVMLMVDTTATAALAFQERAKAEGMTISELFTKLATDKAAQ